MSWFSNIFTGSVGTIIDSVSNAVDKFVTTDKEKLELHNELAKIELEHMLKANELEIELEKQITERHQADMASDSWLSKNIRPLFLIWIMFILTIIIGLDGNLGTFRINNGYINLIESLAITAVVAYFGGRSFDKWSSRKS